MSLKNLVLFFIRVYQCFFSPDQGVLFRFRAPVCRFYPTCSQYSRQAIGHYGLWQGTLLSLKRIGRCHPWHEGGYDPLPIVKKL